MAKKRLNVILENLETVGNWALEGVTEKEIAKRLGISERTLRRYKSEDLSVSAVLEAGSDKTNRQVEYSLLQRALGYEYTEQQPQKVKNVYYDDNGNKCIQEEVVVVDVKKVVLPDVQAQKFWLNNRKDKLWKDNPHKVRNDAELLELRKKEIEAKEW